MATLTMKQIMDIEGISNNQRIFLNTVSFLSKKEGYCWASVSKLSELSKFSESTVKRFVKQLVELGILIEETIYGKNRSHILGRKLFIVVGKKLESKQEQPKPKTTIEEKPKLEPNTEENKKPNYGEFIPQEQKIEKKEVNVSDEVKTALKCKLGLEADEIIENLENKYGSDEVVKAIDKAYYTSTKTKNLIGSTRYLLKMFANGLVEKNNNVKRKEMIDGKNFSYDENGTLVCNYSNPNPKDKSEYTDEELQAIERMKELQAQILGNKFKL